MVLLRFKAFRLIIYLSLFSTTFSLLACQSVQKEISTDLPPQTQKSKIPQELIKLLAHSNQEKETYCQAVDHQKENTTLWSECSKNEKAVKICSFANSKRSFCKVLFTQRLPSLKSLYQGRRRFESLVKNIAINKIVLSSEDYQALASYNTKSLKASKIKLKKSRKFQLDRLYLDRVTTLDTDLLKSLSSANIHALYLNGIKSLNKQQAESLSKLWVRHLHLDGLQNLSPEIAEILVQYKNTLHLGGIKQITPEIAQHLFKMDRLSLDGVRSLDLKTAQMINQVLPDNAFANKEFSLNGLESIDLAIAEELSKVQARKFKLKGLKSNNLSIIVALSDKRFEYNTFDSSKLSKLTVQDAKLLSKYKKKLDLSQFKNIDMPVLKELVTYNGALNLKGLEHISLEQAKLFESLAIRQSRLLNQDKTLNPEAKRSLKRRLIAMRRRSVLLQPKTLNLETAKILKRIKNVKLSLESLTQFTPEMAQVLLDKHMHVFLNSLEMIDMESLKAIIAFKPLVLHLKSITELNTEMAKILCNSKIRTLNLDGLKHLSMEVAKNLTQCPSKITQHSYLSRKYPNHKAFNRKISLLGLQNIDLKLSELLSSSSANIEYSHEILVNLENLLRLQGDASSLTKEMTNVTDQDLALIASHSKKVINLNSLPNLTVEQAKTLVQTKASQLLLNGLHTASVPVLKVLAGFKGRLELDGLSELNLAQAQALQSLTLNELSLNGIKSLSLEVIKVLKATEGRTQKLSLAGLVYDNIEQAMTFGNEALLKYITELKELDVATARLLSKTPITSEKGVLALDTLEKLNPEAAKILASSSVRAMSFKHLNNISLKSLKALSKYKGALNLGGIEQLNLKQAQVMNKFEAQVIVMDQLYDLDLKVAQTLLQSSLQSSAPLFIFKHLVLDDLNLISELYWYYLSQNIGPFTIAVYEIDRVEKALKKQLLMSDLDAQKAQIISQLPLERVSLDGVTKLSAPVIKALCSPNQRLKSWLAKVDSLPQVEANRHSSEEEKLKYLTYGSQKHVAKKLRQTQKKFEGYRYQHLSFKALTELDSPSIQALLTCPVQRLELNGLKALGPKQAQSLSKINAKTVVLNGLAPDQIDAVKKAFADFKGKLSINPRVR